MAKLETPKQEDKNKHSVIWTKIFFIVGLYVSFLFSGIFEEKLYKTIYSSENTPKIKFSHPIIAILLNSFISLVISSGFLLTFKSSEQTPFKTEDKVLLGTYYMLSRTTAENSLNYLDFISKIIGKSCKSVSCILFLI
jgi:hypothetical protein